MRADSIDINTELTHELIIARERRNYILMIKVNMLFSFLVAKISKRNKKHVLYVSVELEKHSWKFDRSRKSCRNTHLSARVPLTAFLALPNFHSCFYKSKETWYIQKNNFQRRKSKEQSKGWTIKLLRVGRWGGLIQSWISFYTIHALGISFLSVRRVYG